MAVVFDASSQMATTTGVNSKSWTHTVGASLTNTALFILLDFHESSAAETISSVTVDGVAATAVGALSRGGTVSSSTDRCVQMFYVLNPTAGDHTIQVTFSATTAQFFGGGVSFAGVDQSSPFATLQTATQTSAGAASTTTTETCPNGTDDMVLSTAFVRTSSTPSLPSGATTLWNVLNSTNNRYMAVYQPGSASAVTTTYSWTTADNAAQQGIAIKAAVATTRNATQSATVRIAKNITKTQSATARLTRNLETFADTFTDLTAWEDEASPGGGSLPSGVSSVSGQLNITCTPAYASIQPKAEPWDISNSYGYVQVIQRPTQGGDHSTEMGYEIEYDINNKVQVVLNGAGSIVWRIYTNNVLGTNSFTTYNATTMKWIRWFGDGSGNLLLQYASDPAGTWTTLVTYTPSWSLRAVAPQFYCGYWGTQATPGTAIFDNFNTPPATQVTKTQTAIARVANTSAATQSAIARIANRRTSAQSAIARLAQIRSAPQSGIARIAGNRARTQSTVSRIANVRTATQSASGRIARNFTKTQVAVARVARSSTKTQNAAGRIVANVTVTQTARARLSNNVVRTQPAIARIANSKSASQLAVSRIAQSRTKTQVAQARIASTLTKSQAAVARILVTRSMTQPTKARIARTQTVSQTLAARVAQTKTVTQSATARVAKTFTKTQTSAAYIINTLTNTQSATARVRINTVNGSTLLAAGSTANLSSYTTGAITPTTGALLLVAVYAVASAATSNIPTLSGCGMTWDVVQTVNDGSNLRQLTVFKAQGAPSNGTLTIDFAGQQQGGADWVVTQFTSVLTTGTNGSAAVVQSNAVGTSSLVSSLSVPLGAFSGTDNATYAAFGVPINSSDPVLPAGYTQAGNPHFASPNQGEVVGYTTFNDTNPTGSWATFGSVPATGIAIEIGASNPQGTASQTAIASIANRLTLTQPAVARLAITAVATQSSKARIARSLTKTQSTQARIARNLTKTQTTTARVARSLAKTQSVIARLANSRSQTQTAMGRIAIARVATQSATAAISTISINTRSQSAVARIASTGPFLQSFNYDFEDGTTQSWTGAIGATVVNSTTQAHSGTQSLAMTTAATGQQGINLPNSIVNNLDSTKLVTMGVWVYNPTATTKTFAWQINQYTAAGVTVNPQVVGTNQSVVPNTWTFVPLTFLPSPTVSRALLRFYVNNAAAIGEVYYFDDITVSTTGYSQSAVARIAKKFTKTQTSIARIEPSAWRRPLNDFESGSDGVAVTTGNSGTNPWDAVTASNSTMTYSATTAAHGALSGYLATNPVSNGSGYFEWTTRVGQWSGIYGRAYLYMPSISSGVRIAEVVGLSGARVGGVGISNTGLPNITASNNAVIQYMTSHVVPNTWFRLEWYLAPGSPGSFELRYYADPDATVATEVISGTNATLGTDTWLTRYRVGMFTALTNYSIYFDDIGFDPAGWLGPAGSVNTQTATARIAVTRTKVQTALARISKVVSNAQPATARIANTKTATQTARARLAQSYTRTQTATTRVATSRTSTQLAIARVANTRTRTQTAVARIAKNITKTQTATARVARLVAKTQTAKADIRRNLVGWWRFDGDLTDSSGNGLDGSMVGTTTYTTDQPGIANKALRLDGTNYVSVPYSPRFAMTDQVTIAAWVTFTSNKINDFDMIVSQGANPPETMTWEMSKDNTNKLRIRAVSSSGFTTALVVQNVGSLTQANTWYHIAVAYDGRTGTGRLWVNGQRSLSTTTNGYIGLMKQAASPLLIGQRDSTYVHSGSIDDVRLYDVVLADTDIAALYSLSLTANQSATARITNVVNVTQAAMARIAQTYTSTQSAAARVAQTRTRTQTVTARVARSLTRNQAAGARVAATVNKTQFARALIVQNSTRTVTQTATARLRRNLTFAQPAVARVELNGLTKTQTATARLYRGLVARWDFNGNGNDSSGNGFNATNTGAFGTTSRTGIANTAMSFSGSAYMQIADDPAFAFAQNPVTITAWVNYNSGLTNNYGAIISQFSGTIVDSFELNKSSTQALRFETRILKGGTLYNARIMEATPSLTSTNTWYHVAASYDPVTGVGKLWVNGQPRTVSYVDPIVTNGVWNDSSMPIYLGARTDTLLRWRGPLDDLRVYDRQLSDDEVAALYIPAFPASTVQSALARIANKRVATQTAISQIANTRTRTQTAIARIAASRTKTQAATARFVSVGPYTALYQTDFESGAGAWGPALGATGGLSTTQAHSGTQSFAITTTASGQSGWNLPNTVVNNINGSQYITVSGWFYNSAAANRTIQWQLNQYDATSTLVQPQPGTAQVVAPNTWTQVQFSFLPNPTSVKLLFRAYVTNAGGADEVYYLDDVMVSTVGSSIGATARIAKRFTKTQTTIARVEQSSWYRPANSFEGGTDGTAITTTNSGSVVDDAWNAVTLTNATLVYSADTAAHGSLSARLTTPGTNGSGFVEWNKRVGQWPVIYGRGYFNLPSTAVGSRVMEIVGPNNVRVAGVAINNTGRPYMTAFNNAPLSGYMNHAVAQNTWCRLEFYVAAGNPGAWELRFYADPDSTVATEILSGTGAGGALGSEIWISKYRAGGLTGLSNFTVYLDDVAFDPNGWIGPAGFVNSQAATARIATQRAQVQTALARISQARTNSQTAKARIAWTRTAGQSASGRIAVTGLDRINLFTPFQETYEGTVPGFTDIKVNQVRATFVSPPAAWTRNGSSTVLAVTPTGFGTNDSNVGFNNDFGALRMGMQAGRTYVFSADLYVPSALTGTLHTRALSLDFFYQTNGVYTETLAQAPNAAGVYHLSGTVAVPANATQAFIRAYHGGTDGAQPIYFDNFTLYQVNPDGAQWQLAVARVSNSITNSQTAKARIVRQLTRTQPASARISRIRLVTQLATAHITAARSKGQSAVARIVMTVVRIQTARARVANTRLRGQYANARIANRRATTQTATASIRIGVNPATFRTAIVEKTRFDLDGQSKVQFDAEVTEKDTISDTATEEATLETTVSERTIFDIGVEHP